MPKRPRYKLWVEKGNGTPIAPEFQPQLQQIILEFALIEDLTRPECSLAGPEKYVAEGAIRLRELIVPELKAAGISLPDEQLTTLWRRAASETFIIRRLLEAKITGEMCKADIKSNPLYKTYKAYFDQTPEIVARAFALVIEAAFAGERQVEKN